MTTIFTSEKNTKDHYEDRKNEFELKKMNKHMLERDKKESQE